MKYRVIRDGVYKTVYDDAVLITDEILIIHEDSKFFHLEVRRLNRYFGNLKISKEFLTIDFGLIT